MTGKASEAGATPEQEIAPAGYVTPKTIAAEIGVSPKRFRAFVRDYVKGKGGIVGVDTPGRGGRYAFAASEQDAIVAAYHAWASKAGAVVISFADEAGDADEAGA